MREVRNQRQGPPYIPWIQGKQQDQEEKKEIIRVGKQHWLIENMNAAKNLS
jgi:hypothetical protein